LSTPEAIHIAGVVIESWCDDDSDELEQRRLKSRGQMKKVKIK
jgi:hypothetical protein